MSLNDDPLRHFHTDLSVGDILRRARLKKGLSIDDLEVAIRVSGAHIKAIEEGRLEVLPGRVYALGFIRAYAEYVGLDSDKILSLLKRQSGEKISPRNITPAQSPILEDHSLPTGKMFVVLFVLFICIVGARSFYTGGNFAPNEQIPAVPNDLKSQMTLLPKPHAATVAAGEADTASATTQDGDAVQIDLTAQAPQPVNQIVLKALGNVWLEIRDAQRRTVFSRVLAMGEEYWVPPDQQGLVMTLGNAGGLQIVVDGQALPLLGKTGQVIRNVALDHDKLKQNLKNDTKPAM